MLSLTPVLWFNGGAEEAATFYCSLFEDSHIKHVSHYGDEGPMAGQVMTVDFELAGRPYQILNGGPHHQLTEAFSISVSVDGQDELDRVWDALIADGGEAGPCGWCKDRWGVSWQVVPTRLVELLTGPDPERSGRTLAKMMTMGKLNVDELEAAADGR
ncbi:MAG TPA: VOC family protein [Mycobacteriales bacterium]|nr:VOC family protein [Mycobacteriales bacterium]